MLKDKKNIVIFILSLIILIMIVGIAILLIFNLVSKTKTIDGSEMSSYELLEMFKQEGYEVQIYKSGNTTIYVNLENEKEGITIQRIYNNYIGNLMTFDDDSINDEMADLIDANKNDTVLKKQQYEAYENWIKKYNITKLQISEMLDKYYNENKNKAVDLDALIDDLSSQ